ncbi:MAG: hypothetical protein PUP91_13670 [Rhizonema sp. PD37]|nr:hypothetical protein [Rhizonema sp. PD37]
MGDILDDKKLTDSLASLHKLKVDAETAAKRNHTHVTLPPGINLPDSEKEANKGHHNKTLAITLDERELGKFYRFDGGRIGGIITEKDGIHHVSLRHLYGTKGTTTFQSAQEADKYLRDVIRRFAHERVVPLAKVSKVISHHSDQIDNLKSKNQHNPYKNIDKEVLHDNLDISGEIEQLLKTKRKAIASVDQHGNLQAAACYRNKHNHLYVDFLSTAGWNLAESHSRKTKGAGAATLAALARKSIGAGHKGRLQLTPLDKAKSFYNHLGFVEDSNGKLHLSPEAAEKLIAKYGGE